MLGANQCFEFSRRSHEERQYKDKNKIHKYYQGNILTTLTTFGDEIQKYSMSRSINTPIKSFRPQRTGNISSSAGHRGILKPIYGSSTRSSSINILEGLSPVPDPDWYLYDEDYYIGKLEAVDIHSIYTSEIDKVGINPRE